MNGQIEIVLEAEHQEGTQSVLSRWLKAVGDVVRAHEPLLEIATDKATVEIPSPAGGVLSRVCFKENDPIAPGQVLGYIDAEGETSAPTREDAPAAARGDTPKSAGKSAPAPLSPAVKQLLKEHGIEASAITGTGKDGRITPDDVLAHVNGRVTGTPAATRMVSHSPMRVSIAKHMVTSLLHTAPHVTSVFEMDLESTIAARDAARSRFEARGAKLTYLAYFVHATRAALRAVPEVNSRWHDEGLELIEDLNIGIATALGSSGLVVPVLREAQKLSFDDLVMRLDELTKRARDGKVSNQEMQGGTFTISNHGVSGSLFAAPIIINQPQSAILGIGKVEKRPKVVGDRIEARSVAYVTLTIDHRALDGFTANTFLQRFDEALQAPPR